MIKLQTILKNLLNEASTGGINIDGDTFPIAFNTIIYDNNQQVFNNNQDNDYPVLVIKDYQKFYDKLSEYITLFIETSPKLPVFFQNIKENQIKVIISFLFANATTEDFLNPLYLIDRNIKFLEDNTFEEFQTPISYPSTQFFESNLEIKRTPQSVYMETPNRLDFTLTKVINDQKCSFILPSISYGITTNSQGEKECYIYSIIHPKSNVTPSEEQDKYTKKINRELYKLNSGVFQNESQEYIDYKNGVSDYYPENISDVSPSSVLSLTIFMGLLQKENIQTIKAVPYLPIRYLSRSIAAHNQTDPIKSEEMMKRNNDLQRNITDKFIRTFARVMYHINNLEVYSYPYQIDEFLTIKVGDNQIVINNQILEEYFTIVTSSTKSNLITK